MDTVCDVEGCIFFDCPESELEKRLQRWQDQW